MKHFVDRGENNDGAPPQIVSSELIQEELERILSSRTFQTAEGQKRFLRFAVEHTLAGRPHEVKEYTVGVEVFGRGQAFDPRLDNIVRTEARKLRSRLAKYYESEGEHDPVRIEFPSRGYVPAFRELDSSGGKHPQTDLLVTLDSESSKTAEEAGWSEPAEACAKADQSSHSGARAVARYLRGHSRHLALLSVVLVIMGAAIYAARLEWSKRNQPAGGPSIAVLPFRNLGDNQDESFSDGLTDELIDSLGRVQGLHVVARTSAFKFRSPTLDVREIGDKLNVRTVLGGSVRIYGNQLRITAELDDTTNGYRVWSNSYERDFKDILFIQRDISQAIVAALAAEFAKNGSPSHLTFAPSKAVPVDTEAYQDYLKGLYFWNKQTSDSFQTAIGYFEQAIAKDPAYALPYTGLARCYVNIPAFTKTRGRDVTPKIKELALKALALDSSLAEPHIDLAYASFLSYDWKGAEAEFKRGLELSPSDAVAHRWYAVYLSNAGRLEEALKENEISQQLDPVSPYVLYGTARSLYMLRLYDESIEQFKKTLALDPQHGYAHLGLGATYVQKRMYREAITELEEANQEMRSSPASAAGLAYAYAISGKTAEAQKILLQLLDDSAHGPFPAKPIAEIYVGLGENDRAFEWLEKAIDGQDVNLSLKTDPIYDPLRSDPRFVRLLHRARLD